MSCEIDTDKVTVDMTCETLEMIPPVVAMSRVSIARAPVHSGKYGGILTFLGYPRAGTLQSSWAQARVLRVANCGNGHGGLRLLHEHQINYQSHNTEMSEYEA